MDNNGKKIALLIIDPQNDFCSPEGKLYVDGADRDNERLAMWILRNKDEIDQIFVTLDSHHILDISHPNFWINGDGDNPRPFTIISSKDVISGMWKPAFPFFNEGVVVTYLETLEKQGEFKHCIWPEHCIIGSWGQSVDTMIGGALREWVLSGSDAKFVSYLSKGHHPMTEHFGVFKAQVAVKSAPDTEITHDELSGLTTGDAGHTQFAMLQGRAGGQTLQGGTAASETLVLESTSNVTKGSILTKDNFTPFTNASFSGSWSGTDLGDYTHYFRDLYTKGELKGARLENYTFATLPAASAQNIGRVVFATDVNKAYVDVGTSFKVLGVSKFVADQSFDGVVTLKDVNVSAEITDARNAQWQLRDNANDFEILYVTIKATSTSNVRIQTNVPLPAGSYRLIGVE